MSSSKLKLVQQSIRLLVVDEGIALGGVERMWLALMPELSKRCEKVVWMLPAYRLEPTQGELPLISGITFESIHWPHWNAAKLKSAIIKRMVRGLSRFNSTYAKKSEQNLFNERLEHVIRQHKITHVLYPALFIQPFPKVSLPVFASIMDINYNPSWHDECIANLIVWAQKANQLVAISKFTKDEVEQECSQAYGKVAAIPIASNAVASWNPRIEAGEAPSFYYPASFNPHKGHTLLLKALQQLHEAGMDFRLILTGVGTLSLNSKTPLNIPELETARQVVASASDSFRLKIEIRGRVSTEEVDICFAHASLVVLPSSYEGFGLPLAEAVARGKRVVCADIPAFREQVQLYGFDRAVSFVSGANISAWASAIQVVLRQPPQSPYSSDELHSLFARRTWKNVAADYVRVLSECG